MANREDNLIPQSHILTVDDQKKGGLASAEARRKKATMLDVLSKTLDEIPKNGKNPNNLSYREMATLGLIKGAINGNGKNYELIANMMQEKEKKNDEDKPLIYIPAKDIPRSFVDVYRDIEDRKHFEYWFEGGRGSDKSSMWSEIVAELLENNPRMCALLIRKVGNTLKDSVYSQMQWGIDKLSETYPSIIKHWKATKSPLEIVNENTGQVIYFRGADDPVKIKSIKPPKDKYIGIVVYEEFDQMNGMNEVGTIDRSVIRGGEDFIVFRVYNTPTSSQHFVNKEKRIPKADRFIHRSTYLDVPKEWLGQKFFDEAEYMKSVNEKQYRNIYLGEETGTGGNVFENIDLREITEEEINNFDYIYQGIDFGWFPDPLAWTKMCYNPSQKTLYIFDEFVINKMSNEDVWNYLKENKGVKEDDLITADSAEPKSIGDFKSYGAFIRSAEKGPGSVDYSMKWLASLTKIVIDPNRCPKSAEEFSTYEYEQDKDGNYISGYVDANNHCIDSCRYALNSVWKKKGN
jgi:PBSX family phage terminase large subunit